MRRLAVAALLALAAGCAGPATGPLNGILLVCDPSLDPEELDSLLDGIRLTVSTVEEEDVFSFSTCTPGEFSGDLRNRRTILFVVSSPENLPDGLVPDGGVWSGSDVWAEGQDVFGVVLPDDPDPDRLSGLLESSYDRHLTSWLYGSFVSTQMSSPERVDSLLTLGFSMDIPKSYRLECWEPGFVQYQRQAADDCLLMLSIRWIGDGRILTPPESVLWRESVARGCFYDAEADSVDRSRVQAVRIRLRGIEGYRLTGMWRNPVHLNAGAFTSYILFDRGTRYLLDMEIYHEHREKEPFVREGWIIMNTFAPGS